MYFISGKTTEQHITNEYEIGGFHKKDALPTIDPTKLTLAPYLTSYHNNIFILHFTEAYEQF